MSNINFLPTKGKRDAHKKSDKKEDIKWSKPIEGKRAEDKGKSSGRFSFFKKNSAKDKKLKEGRFDKNKFKRSRKEVLQLIKEKEYARDQDSSIKSQVLKIKAKKESNPLAWLSNPRITGSQSWLSVALGKLRKHKGSKGTLSGYQKNFKQKEKTENIPVSTAHSTPLTHVFAPPIARSGVMADKKTMNVKKTIDSHSVPSTKHSAAYDHSFERQREGNQQLAKKLTDNKKDKKKSSSWFSFFKKSFAKDKKSKEKERKGKKEKSGSISSTSVNKKEKWENPDILETNLIKGEIIFFFNWRKGIIQLLIAVILACLAIGVVYGGLDFWQKQKEKKIQKIAQKFIGLNQQIRQANQGVDEILAWRRKLGLASTLLDNHIYWTNFFKFLEDNTLVDVYFPGGFSGNTSGSYNLSAVGVSYNTIHQQVKTLKLIDQVVKVGVTSGSFTPAGEDSQSSINFNLELSVDPEIFYKE